MSLDLANMVAPSKKLRCDDVDFAVIERPAEPIIVDQDLEVQCFAIRNVVTFQDPALPYGKTLGDMAELAEVGELLQDPTIDTPLPKRKLQALLERLPADTSTGWEAPYLPYGEVDFAISAMTALMHSMPSVQDPADDPYPLPATWVFLPQGW